MNLLIIFLTAILVLTCLILALLVLIQLPKKEAGAGVAFGGAATDALFGAGSGNALTKATKYAGTFFVALAAVLSILYSNQSVKSERSLEEQIEKQATTAPAMLPPTNQVAPVPGTPSTTPLTIDIPTNPAVAPAETPATPPANTSPETESSTAPAQPETVTPAQPQAPAAPAVTQPEAPANTPQ